MKTKLFLTTALTALLAAGAYGQSSGGSAGASGSGSADTSGTAGSASGAGSANVDANAGFLPPGLEKRDELPPGLQNRDQLPPGLQRRVDAGTNTVAGTTNQFGSTNQIGIGGTNQLGIGTNQFGGMGTNQFNTNAGGGLTPTSDPRTNRFQGRTNNVSMQDRATTTADQTLLVQIRQAIQTQVTTAVKTTTSTPASGAIADSPFAPAAALPVYFVVNNGLVRILGFVPSTDERRRVETVVQQVPGVVRVVNQLQVRTDINSTANVEGAAGAGGTAGTTNEFHWSGTNTVVGGSGTNTIVGGSTNRLTPTGTNGVSRRYQMPPGLQNRDELPPGLQRDPLPPGLQGRTNSNGTTNQ